MDYYSAAVACIDKASEDTDQQVALVNFAHVFASLALVDEPRETNALLGKLLKRLRTSALDDGNIEGKLSDISNLLSDIRATTSVYR
jgi:hypothetical protein